jgi:tetratricopeptide (TPR) repeat protein
MKTMNINKLSAILGVLLLMFFASCSIIEDIEYEVVQNPLQMHGGDVTLQINGKFIEKGLNAKVVAEVTPILFCADGNEIPFQTEIFQGAKAAGNGKVVPAEGMAFNYSSTIPFQKCMSEGEVKVRVVVKKGEEEAIDPILTDKIADATTTTPLLLELDDHVISSKECNFKRINSFTKTATINFAKSKHAVSSKEMRDSDIKEVLSFITESTKEGSKIEIKSIEITSFASPEGEIDLNTDLALDRGESAMKFLMSKARRMKFEAGKEKSFYTVSPKGEDWSGFKEEVSKTENEDKELILRVLQMTSDLNKREQEIRNMAKSYKFLEKEVLPQLRRATIIVNYDEVGYSDEELKNLVATNPDTLNVEEIFQASINEQDMNTKLRNYNEAERLFSNDWRIINNKGYVLFMMGDVDGAGQSFEKALSITDNATVTNNIAAVKHIQTGKGSDDIVSYLESSNTKESKYNLGLINIENGKYDEAITLMGDSKSFSLALANLLSEKYDIATDILDGINSDNANAKYLKAILGSRTDNSEMVFENLKASFEADPSLKEKAKKDREFLKYFENADFLAIF